jgi:phosphoglycolate phosphatase
MKKLVIFDFDGTIADTRQLSLDIFHEISARNGMPRLSDEEVEEIRQLPIKKRLKMFAIPLRKIPKYMRESWDMFYDKVTDSKPIEGIETLLKALKDHDIESLILSSNHEKNIQKFLDFYSLHYFTKTYGGAKLFGKQSTLKKILRKHKLTPNDVLYVGDETRDIVSCKKVNIPIAAVTWGFDSKNQLLAESPEFMCEVMDDLRNAIFQD